MKNILVDSNILVDLFLPSSPRHSLALKLHRYIKKYNLVVTVPVTALFELAATMKRLRGQNGRDSIPKKVDFNLHPVDITQHFLATHYDDNLPYLPVGDFIFLCIASKEKVPFITEDVKLYKAARKTDLKVYTLQEYLNENNIR